MLDTVAKISKVLRKLDRPPAGPNWARFVYDDQNRTTKALLAFAKGRPTFTYQPGYRAIKDRIELGISVDAMLRSVAENGAPAGRTQNKEFVEAFIEYEKTRKYSASNPIGFDVEYFRVSREVLVPVAPLSVIREKRRFVPIFACGWADNPLILMQRRLLMTIYEDAFLSLTDFQDSPAEVLFFPRMKGPDAGRKSEVWKRGDYNLLRKKELNEYVEIFILAREAARKHLLEQMEVMREQEAEAAKPAPSTVPSSKKDLFS
jgi:hypothetical protein